MRFDPDDGELFFNEEMILSEESSKICFDRFMSWSHECVKNPGMWFKNVMPDSDGDSKIPQIAGLIAGIGLFAGLVGSLLCLPVKRYDLIPWIMGAAMAVIGIVSLVFPVIRGAKVFSESALAIRIEGAIAVLGAIGQVVIKMVVPYDNLLRFTVIVGLELCIVFVLVMTVKTIGIFNAPKSIYREEVQATCVGYVRTYESYGTDGAGSNYYPVYSPVFEYRYGGELFRSYYDLMINGKDAKIPVGGTCQIKIDPDEPERVMGNCKKYAVTPFLFVFIGIVAIVVLAVMLIANK